MAERWGGTGWNRPPSGGLTGSGTGLPGLPGGGSGLPGIMSRFGGFGYGSRFGFPFRRRPLNGAYVDPSGADISSGSTPSPDKGSVSFIRRIDQGEGTPGGGSTGGGGGGGSNQGQPDPQQPPVGGSVGYESPYDQPLRQFGGAPLGNPYSLVEKGTYDNDDLWRLYRSQRSFGNVQSTPRAVRTQGAGLDGMYDPVRKLVLARYRRHIPGSLSM